MNKIWDKFDQEAEREGQGVKSRKPISQRVSISSTKDMDKRWREIVRQYEKEQNYIQL